ncbi:cell wall-binding protein [Desulfitobacterium dehalogenans ATCC 51507]|uniref:Cell wall-binding protein n=1 Tax=Desulfitobacterium dehalogenans (strain ATCC 51507 / DSM 9161 / JW/IU-DC1) TaxID=756499 RepID=I4ADT2_DESDJ|nr:cell wall-binding repeat-containing protein [Desulfitobacterium dehalogenans]AFM02117.1 cell wall-binding protein [Desulfitobacterium dehalogenans ATCC 51507]
MKTQKNTKPSVQWYYLLPLIFVMAAVPLIVHLKVIPLSGVSLAYWNGSAENYDFFSYYKGIGVIIAALSGAFLVIVRVFQNTPRLVKKSLRPYYTAAVLYFLLITASAVVSDFRSVALSGFPDRYEGMYVLAAYLLIFLVTTALVSDEKQVKLILGGLLAGALVIGLIGLFQYIGYDVLKSDIAKSLFLSGEHKQIGEQLTFKFDKNVIYATLYHYNYVGSYIAMLFPLCFALLVLVKDKRAKAGLSLMTVLMGIVWLGCNARSGIVGGGLALLVFLIAINKMIRKHWKYFGAGLLVMIALAIGLNQLSGGYLSTRAMSLYTDTRALIGLAGNAESQEDSIPLKAVNINGKQGTIVTDSETLNFTYDEDRLVFMDSENKPILYTYDRDQGTMMFSDPKYTDYLLTVGQLNGKGALKIQKGDIQLFFGLEPEKLTFLGPNGREISLEPIESWGFTGYERIGSSRGYIWSRSLPLLKNTLFLGYGPDTFAIVFPQHDILGKMYAYHGDMWQIVDKPHNQYLQIAINTGIISLLAFLFIVVYYLYQSFRLYVSNPFRDFLSQAGVAVFIAIVGYLGAAFFNDSVVSVAPVFWCLLGLGVSINHMLKAKPSEGAMSWEDVKKVINMKILSRKITGILLGAVLLIFSLDQQAYASTTVSRLSGSDRYQTAVAISQSGWPDGADNVVITTGQNFPDALSAATLAGKNGAPILLAGPKGFSPETLREIKRLSPKKAYIVGGLSAVPNSVESQLSANGITSTRLSGKDRYDTAMAVARSVGMSKGIIIVPGESFADALSAAPLAAAEGMPIIPVPSDDMTKNQKSYFARAKLSRVIILGTAKEIPQVIRSQFAAAENITGADPYTRNIALLQKFSESLSKDRVFIATGQAYPDALAAAAYAQMNNNPVILLNGNQISAAADKYFSTQVIDEITVLGGEGVIASSTVQRLANLTPTVSEVKSIDVAVKENQSYTLPKTIEAKTSQGNWAQVPVTWNLTNVSTAKTGTYYYTGSVKGYDGTVELVLTVEAGPVKVDTFGAEVIRGSDYSLPETVTVSMSDHSIKKLPVQWSSTPTATILNKAGTYTFQGTVEGTDLTTTLSLKVSEDKAIEFKDGSLEWAVKYTLGKQSSPQPAYLSEVLELTSLNLDGYGIRDLTGLEACSNLRTLDLRNNFLKGSNLSTLQRLPDLEYLNLRNNDLEQVDTVRNLTKLTYLDISLNKIKDFAPIRDLTRLTSLFLKSNETQDFSATRSYYPMLKEKDFTL